MGCCPWGTLSPPKTLFQHVLWPEDEWKTIHTGGKHTVHTVIYTHRHVGTPGTLEDALLVFPFISLHITRSCELKHFSLWAPSFCKIVFSRNDLWVQGKTALTDSTFPSIWYAPLKKARKKYIDKRKEENTTYLKKIETWNHQRVVK